MGANKRATTEAGEILERRFHFELVHLRQEVELRPRLRGDGVLGLDQKALVLLGGELERRLIVRLDKTDELSTDAVLLGTGADSIGVGIGKMTRGQRLV